MAVIDTVIVESKEKIGDSTIFTLAGNINRVKNGFKFSYEGKEYRVKTVAMICNGHNVMQDRIDVTVEEI